MVHMKSRTHFSIQHIWSGAYLARCAGKIEREYQAGVAQAEFFRHRAYVTTAIATAVAALEAAVNELFSDAADGHTMEIAALGEETIDLFAKMWDYAVPRTARYRVVEKFEIALALAKKPRLDLGVAPCQEVSTIIALRNALIHYEPAWMRAGVSETPKGEEHKLEKRLKDRFSLNPLTGAGNPFFPDKCLSYGCASWAVQTAIAFTDLTFGRLGLKPRYEHLRAELHTTGDP